MMMVDFWLEKPTNIDKNQFSLAQLREFRDNFQQQKNSPGSEKTTENQIEKRFVGKMQH